MTTEVGVFVIKLEDQFEAATTWEVVSYARITSLSEILRYSGRVTSQYLCSYNCLRGQSVACFVSTDRAGAVSYGTVQGAHVTRSSGLARRQY